MADEVLIAIIGVTGVIVSSIAAGLVAVAIARINSTNTAVGHATDQATAANTAAVEARNYSKPTGNGYADESRAAWRQIQDQLTDLSERQTQTNAWLTRHLSDHARANILREPPGIDNEEGI